MDLALKGKRVIVTGGSKGIGRSITEAFLKEGARVAICARDEATLTESAAELGKLGVVYHYTADLSDAAAAVEFVNWAATEMGGLDILVSNVSAMSADFRACVEVDIIGVQALLRAGLEHIEDHTGGNIVCISSRAASVGIPYLQAYAAVKAATVSMVKSMALEVARRGIRVNVVSPGDIEFPGGSWERNKEDNPKLYNAILKGNPFRRLGRPEEIGDVVAFVASERSSFMSGANLLVDGAATTSLQL
jgi:3-oxoacyl-[acyl-carrier protein] reductase